MLYFSKLFNIFVSKKLQKSQMVDSNEDVPSLYLLKEIYKKCGFICLCFLSVLVFGHIHFCS